jgi:hypothetical protein
VVVHIKIGWLGRNLSVVKFPGSIAAVASSRVLRNCILANTFGCMSVFSEQSIRSVLAMDSCENSVFQANGICGQRHVA